MEAQFIGRLWLFVFFCLINNNKLLLHYLLTYTTLGLCLVYTCTYAISKNPIFCCIFNQTLANYDHVTQRSECGL